MTQAANNTIQQHSSSVIATSGANDNAMGIANAAQSEAGKTKGSEMTDADMVEAEEQVGNEWSPEKEKEWQEEKAMFLQSKEDPVVRNHKISYRIYRWFDPISIQLRGQPLEDDHVTYAAFCDFKGPAEAEFWKAQAERARKPKEAKDVGGKINKLAGTLEALIKEAQARGLDLTDITAKLASLGK